MTNDHLSESTRLFLENLGSDPDNEARILNIKEDKWVSYTFAELLLGGVENLMNHPRVIRPQGMLVSGDSQYGKSSFIERIKVIYKDIENAKLQNMKRVIAFEMPADPNIGRFLNSLLTQGLGKPEFITRSTDSLLRHVLFELQDSGVEMILIDEIQHIGNCQPRQLAVLLGTLKSLVNRTKLPIVAFGIDDAAEILSKDEQLYSRFLRVDLPEWEPGHELKCLLATYETILPLKKPSNLSEDELHYAILGRTNGSIGEITRLLQEAAVIAIKKGDECITIDLVKNMPFQSCRPAA